MPGERLHVERDDVDRGARELEAEELCNHSAVIELLEKEVTACNRELARYAVAESETWAHPAVIEAGLVK